MKDHREEELESLSSELVGILGDKIYQISEVLERYGYDDNNLSVSLSLLRSLKDYDPRKTFYFQINSITAIPPELTLPLPLHRCPRCNRPL